MRKFFLLISLLSFSFVTAQAQNDKGLVPAKPPLKKVTFAPQWTPQSQFAGFYVALENGFYEEEGLDVTIKHMASNYTGTAMDLLLKNEAQIVGLQLLQAMVSRSDGNKILNVMQLTQKTGLLLVSNKHIDKFVEADGMKIGKWRAGFSEICEMIENVSNISINWVPFISGINLFVYGAVDGTLAYSYSEFLKLKLAIGDIPEENIFRFSETTINPPEDGLYVTEEYYSKNKEIVDAFVRASKKGWDYAFFNPEEALEITMKYIVQQNIVTNETFQRMMLEEYVKLLINPISGKVDYAPIPKESFDYYQDLLLSSGLTVNPIKYEEIIR